MFSLYYSVAVGDSALLLLSVEPQQWSRTLPSSCSVMRKKKPQNKRSSPTSHKWSPLSVISEMPDTGEVNLFLWFLGFWSVIWRKSSPAAQSQVTKLSSLCTSPSWPSQTGAFLVDNDTSWQLFLSFNIHVTCLCWLSPFFTARKTVASSQGKVGVRKSFFLINGLHSKEKP